MSGFDIDRDVKEMLADANEFAGPNPYPIYKEVKTLTGGDAVTPPVEVVTKVPLVDAIFQSYDQKDIADSLIQAGDRRIVCNGDVPLVANDIISENGVKYIVIFAKNIIPAGVPLAFKAQVRRQ